MRRRAFVSATGLAACGAALGPFVTVRPGVAAQSAAATTECPIPGLEERISELLPRHRLPGLCLAIVRKGQEVWTRGFGVADSASGRPVDGSTVFEAQSMSKPAFAYVVLKLCEKGVLGLDTPLTRYGPAPTPPGDARVDLITARHVLSHTSGLPNWRSGNGLVLRSQPGERFLYSGEGYAWLQSVVTRLTGHEDPSPCGTYEGDLRVCATDIGAFLQARLLVPFGMAASAYVWSPALEGHMARRHDETGAPLPERRPTATDAARYASSGGLLTTPGDYARFLAEVVAPRPADSFRLGKDTLGEMLRPAIRVSDEPASWWALGWQILATSRGPVIAHGGDNPGTHCFAAASVARQSAFVVMTNGTGGVEVLKAIALGESLPRMLDL